MDPASATDYQRLTERLAVFELTPSASEAHGMLCGLICAGHPQAEATWVEELLAGTDLNDLTAQDCRQSLQALADQTREEIVGPGVGLTLLLPGDERPLPERALGLYDWSRGFLYGLGIAGVDEKDISDQAREVLHDFAAITRLDLDALDESEDDEESLTELTEFAWVAAMLMYEERSRREEPN
ncbi:MAG: UPF0149 family protein [Pseudomonadota bacterium]|nr:UPF0149 family protein [Pseudomonadota bacterium]